MISVIRNFLITADDDKSCNTKHYGCQIIVAIFFRVNPNFHYANFIV
ncbi:MAG: virulence RhuM family protein [Puniceicoccales bacterium]|nr:virulence RhuM family protein [Puniceicoccales bacterium]